MANSIPAPAGLKLNMPTYSQLGMCIVIDYCTFWGFSQLDLDSCDQDSWVVAQPFYLLDTCLDLHRASRAYASSAILLDLVSCL